MKKYVLFLILSAWSYSLHAQAFWQKMDNGLESTRIERYYFDEFKQLNVVSKNHYAHSKDGGKTWQNTPFLKQCSPSVVTSATEMYCYVWENKRIVYSNDEGQTWNEITMPTVWGTVGVAYQQFEDLVASKNHQLILIVYAENLETKAAQRIFYLYESQSHSWRNITAKEFLSLAAEIPFYKISVDGKSLLNSTDGTTWNETYTSADVIRSWHSNGTSLWIMTASGMKRSSDQGQTWKNVPLPTADLFNYEPIGDTSRTYLVIKSTTNTQHEYYYSEDGGDSWKHISFDLNIQNIVFAADPFVYFLDSQKQNALFRRDLRNQNALPEMVFGNRDVGDIKQVVRFEDGQLWCVANGKLYQWQPNSSVWQPINLPLNPSRSFTFAPVHAIYRTNQGNLYAVIVYPTEDNFGDIDTALYESKDNGETWRVLEDVIMDGHLEHPLIPRMISKEGMFYFEKKDKPNELLQTKLRSDHTFESPISLVYLNEFMSQFLVTDSKIKPEQTIIYGYSTNGLKTWKSGVGETLKPDINVADGSNLKIKPYLNGVLLYQYDVGKAEAKISVDEGQTWQKLPTKVQKYEPIPSINPFPNSQFPLIADVNGGIWTIASPFYSSFSSVIFSSDKGKTWEVKGSSLTDILDLYLDHNGVLYVITLDGIYRSLQIVITANESADELPSTFSTSAAYPNPFSQSTTFGVSLPKASRVNIGIYNILGQRIHTLSDVDLPAGTHSFDWQAADVPSGVYFARIVAEGKVQSQKLTVVH
jgi:photosystem II stability/assembly factor-like uncharacterized protein